MVESGHEVDVYTARISPDLSTFEKIDGVNVYRINTPKGLLKQGGEFRVISDVFRFTFGVFNRLLFTKKRYDIYEVNHCPLFPVFVAELASKIRRVPISITFHEVWKELWYNYVNNKVFCTTGILLERLTTRMGRRIIAVSDVTRERLISCYNVPPNKITVINNGISFALYQRESTPKIPHKIVYLGRLNKHKNVDLLIQAFQIVKKIIPDATLDIAGDGPERTRLEALGKGISDITFHGIVTEEQKAKLLLSGWIYVLPSVREGQGITLLEAMASGTPTIAVFYEGSGVVSIIHHGENGLLAMPNSQDIADTILRYDKSPQFYAHIQQEGLRFVQAMDWNDIALDHEILYRSILGEKISHTYSERIMSGEHPMDNALK